MKPILFSGPMVRAILDGLKTQTRRVIKPQPSEGGLEWLEESAGFAAWQDPCLLLDEHSEDGGPCQRICPYGRVGDELWVRETFQVSQESHEPDGHYNITYLADDEAVEIDYSEIDMGRLTPGKKYPSIFMPRWACRLFLKITDIRVEQLQDINESDAIAEGIPVFAPKGVPHESTIPRKQFAGLWDSINAKRGYGWDENPFVWVIQFKTTKG